MTSKQVSLLFASCMVVALLGASVCMAQSNPVEYMKQFSDRESMLSEKYMSYMSEVAHRGRARKMEKRRLEVVNGVKQNIKEIGALKPYKGDASLRDAYKEYWSVLYNVLNDDYAKIVDMEEVAEQSYDAMEAYLLIQEKANAKLEASYDKVSLSYRAFAASQNVQLVDGGDTELSKKLNKTGMVNQYTNQVYLIFFKSYIQEATMLQGLSKMDINAIEQAKGSLKKYSAEGLTKLDTLKPFKNDVSLASACKKVLAFHQSEADQFEQFTSFLIKRDDFEKYKKTFDAKPAGKRTQADIDQYNKLLTDYNGSIKKYNQVNNDLNNNRAKALDGFDKARAKFMDTHVPRA
jgi:hypothetical protein